MKPYTQKFSWKDTYREMAASDEDLSDWDAVINDGLEGNEEGNKFKR